MFTRPSDRQTFSAALLAIACIVATLVWLPPVRAAETPVIATRLLNAASALNATGSIVVGSGTMSRCRESALYLVWGAGVASGAVKVESAVDENYTGTWAPLATVAWSAASKQDIVQITGVHWAIRTRISTVLAGGTISTYLVCN